jgi:hypothetical protein
MENSEYIKKLERENEYLNKILRCSLWFRGIENIKKPWEEHLKNHPHSLIDVGWFWFTEHGPEIVECIENAMEPGSVKRPLMCSIQYINHSDGKGDSGWFLYDGGTYKHPLETFKNYWFAGPLIAPYRDLLNG